MSAEYDYVCVNGHDRCGSRSGDPNCPMCERRRYRDVETGRFVSANKPEMHPDCAPQTAVKSMERKR